MPGRTVHLAFSIAVVLLVQGAARAAPLQWEGTLSFQFLAGLPPLQVESGGIATVNASSGGVPAHLATLRLDASRQKDLVLTETGLVTDPDVPGYYGLQLFVTASLDPGTFSAISGGAASTGSLGGRELPLRGVFRFDWLFPTAPLTWLTVNGAPAGVGVGGGYLSQTTHTTWTRSTYWHHDIGSTSIPFPVTFPVDEIRWLSILGAPWTIKTATASVVDPPVFYWSTDQPPPAVVSATRRGFAHAPASTTTSTAQPGGVLQMVTPMQVRVDHWRLRYGSDLRYGWAVGGFGVLTIRFIPEPGIGLLLATGLVGLVAVGRQRMRR